MSWNIRRIRIYPGLTEVRIVVIRMAGIRTAGTNKFIDCLRIRQRIDDWFGKACKGHLADSRSAGPGRGALEARQCHVRHRLPATEGHLGAFPVDAVNWIIVNVREQVRLSTREPNRVYRRPSSNLRVVVPRPKPDRPGPHRMDGARRQDRLAAARAGP